MSEATPHRQFSRLPELARSVRLSNVRGAEPLEVTLHLRRRRDLATDEELLSQAPGEYLPMGPQDFEQQHGLADEDLAEIEAFAEANHLHVGKICRAARMVVLAGDVEHVNRAFGVRLEVRRDATGEHRAYTGEIHVPECLAKIVETVTGLEDRSDLQRFHGGLPDWEAPRRGALPVSRPGRARSTAAETAAPRDLVGAAAPGEPSLRISPTRVIPLSQLTPPGLRASYYPDEVARWYNFPPHLNGAGQTVGIVAFQGAYLPGDLAEFCRRRQLSVPEVITVAPFKPRPDDSIFSYEVTADVQAVAGAAPGARIVLFYADPSLPQYYLRAVKSAIYDPKYRPSALSISYGSAEKKFKTEDMLHLNEVFRDAARMGITICVASGDGGSASAEWRDFDKPAAHVSFPATSPYALACGGSTLDTGAGAILREEVFNFLNQCVIATGGGVSEVFARPAYQQELSFRNVNPGVAFQGRGIPDVAGNAAPETGYSLIFQGVEVRGQGGTSFVAPLWAGLVARLNQGLSEELGSDYRVGFLNPHLYRLQQAGVCRPIVSGSNGAYRAAAGWNPCTGLGAPDGTKLFQELLRLAWQSRRRILRARGKAINHRDRQALGKCYAADAMVTNEAGAVVLQGREAIVQQYEKIWRQPLRIELLQEIACGPWIVQRERVGEPAELAADRGDELLVLLQLEGDQIIHAQLLVCPEAWLPGAPPQTAPATRRRKPSAKSRAEAPREPHSSPKCSVQRRLEAFNQGNLDALLECFAPDAVIEDAAGQPLAEGIDQLRRHASELFAAHPGIQATILAELTSGPWVVQKTRVSGLQQAAKQFVEGLVTYRIDNNRIRRARILTCR